jgi:hypothetical protein
MPVVQWANVEWAKIVTASVVPVVIISACGLLCLTFYNRLAAIVSRVRGFQRERLREQELLGKDEADADEIEVHRKLLALLETQTARVTRRAKLIRLTLQFLLLAIGMLIVCSMLLGLSVLWPGAMVVSVILFMVGLASMMGAIIAALMELRTALEPAELESQFVSDLLHQEGLRVADAA